MKLNEWQVEGVIAMSDFAIVYSILWQRLLHVTLSTGETGNEKGSC